MIPNQLFNRPGNFLLFGKFSQPMTRKLLLMLVFSLFFVNASAQDSKKSATPSPITHVDQFVSLLKSSGNDVAAKHVQSLIKEVKPSAYASAGNVEVKGGTPVCLYVDAKTMSTIGALDMSKVDKKQIEMVVIKVNNAQDMNGGIDLTPFNDFPSLKYVYILAEYVTTAQSIIASVENNNPKYSVFYNILRAN